jgi:hypothetical protein
MCRIPSEEEEENRAREREGKKNDYFYRATRAQKHWKEIIVWKITSEVVRSPSSIL